MARPTKATVAYFPHTTTHGKTLFVIEQLYGNDGYAFWFKLLEQLGNSEHHFFDLTDISELEFFAAKCKVSKEKTLEMLTKLSELGAIDNFLFDNKIVFSKNFVDGVKDAYSKRTEKCWSKDDLLHHLYTSKRVSVPRNPQSKVEEIKENKNKENEITAHTQDPFSHFKILGKRKNVYLTDKHLNQLDCLIGSRNKVNELIDEVSDAIGLGKYDKWNCELEDAHCILVEKFYKHQKKNNTGIKLGKDSGLDLSKIDFK